MNIHIINTNINLKTIQDRHCIVFLIPYQSIITMGIGNNHFNCLSLMTGKVHRHKNTYFIVVFT